MAPFEMFCLVPVAFINVSHLAAAGHIEARQKQAAARSKKDPCIVQGTLVIRTYDAL